MIGDRALRERTSELSTLEQLVDGARVGSGRVVLLEGPAGIGKTRLLEEVRNRAGTLGFRILTGSGSELEHDFAFGVVRQLLEPAVTDSRGNHPQELWCGAARFAEPVFADPDLAVGGGNNPSQAILHGLFSLVVRLAQSSPVLLAIDDVHWADQPSLRFVRYLGRRVERLPVLVDSHHAAC